MTKEAVQTFVETMVPVILEAGAFAASQQGRVENIGKELE